MLDHHRVADLEVLWKGVSDRCTSGNLSQSNMLWARILMAETGSPAAIKARESVSMRVTGVGAIALALSAFKPALL
jgi:hypothetical protein